MQSNKTVLLGLVAALVISTASWTTTAGADEGLWKATKEKSSEIWDATKKNTNKLWEATKEGSSDQWEQAKASSDEAWEEAKRQSHEAWEMAKDGFVKRPTMIGWHERGGLGVALHGILITMVIGIFMWPMGCSVPVLRRIIAPPSGGMIFEMEAPQKRFLCKKYIIDA